ncbi:MAG TPA: hypothetical protein ACFYD4_00520, partial [Candidatus Wunengus sp. YC61]|uniref:hypothetical protein n=1 Tax=Candidatus Wunengus sp. YC61 TaxID=3367698 RepID=UPI00402A21D4
MKVIVFLILGILLSTYGVFTASAGYITIKTETTVAVDDSNLKVKVVVTNEGDESAFNVQININENQRTQSSPIKQMLTVKENFEYEANYRVPQIKHGRYPLIINVDYTDANQYPFSALTGTYYSFGSDTVSKVFGSANDIRLARYTTLPLKLKNIDEESKEVLIRLIVPKESSVQEKVKKVTIQPRSEVNTIFNISNFSALPGSRYQVFFILEYEDENKHYSNIIPCSIHVDASKGFFKRYKWY